MTTEQSESAKGKRFSRRTVITDETEFGPVIWERIDPRAVFTRTTVEDASARATRLLEGLGVPVNELLRESPHGSAVREHVLSIQGEEPDTVAALAARLLEVALHLLAYMDMGSADKVLPSLAFQFGRLEMLLHVYEVEAELQARRRQDKPLADPYDTSRNKRLRTFHAGLVAAHAQDATKQTAAEFGISERQVRNILNSDACRK